MVDTIFFRAERQDATVYFPHDLGPGARRGRAAMPGVLSRRAVPRRAGGPAPRSLPAPADGRRASRRGRTCRGCSTSTSTRSRRRAEGLLVSERVAELLHARPGDKVAVELVERGGRTVEVPVTADRPELHRPDGRHAPATRSTGLSRTGRGFRGCASASTAPASAGSTRRSSRRPMAGSLALLKLSRGRFRETIDQNIAHHDDGLCGARRHHHLRRRLQFRAHPAVRTGPRAGEPAACSASRAGRSRAY